MSKSDPIGKACSERMTAGNLAQVVSNAETYKPHSKTFNLRLVANYHLEENARNTFMVKQRLKELNSNQSPTRKKRGNSPPSKNKFGG